MKTFKIVVVLLLVVMVFGCSSNKGSKKDDAVKPLLLDSERIARDDKSYPKELQEEALASLANAALLIGQNDFNSISEAYSSVEVTIQLSEEAALQALGLREAVVAKKAETKALEGGNAGAEKADLSEEAKKEKERILEEKVKLVGTQKDYFLVSITQLASAIAKEKIIVDNTKNYIDNVKEMSAMKKAKEAKNLKRATAIASSLPGNIASQLGTLKTYIDIALTNNIKIPVEVTNLF